MQKWNWTQKEGMGLPELGESKCHRAGTQVLGVSMQDAGCPLLSRPPPARPPTTMPSHSFFKHPGHAQWGSGAGSCGPFISQTSGILASSLQGRAPAPGAGIRGSPGVPVSLSSLLCLAQRLVLLSGQAQAQAGAPSLGRPACLLVGRMQGWDAGEWLLPFWTTPTQATSMADLASPPASWAYCKDEVKQEMGKQLDWAKRGHQISAGLESRVRTLASSPVFCPLPGTQFWAHNFAGLQGPHCRQGCPALPSLPSRLAQPPNEIMDGKCFEKKKVQCRCQGLSLLLRSMITAI